MTDLPAIFKERIREGKMTEREAVQRVMEWETEQYGEYCDMCGEKKLNGQAKRIWESNELGEYEEIWVCQECLESREEVDLHMGE